MKIQHIIICSCTHLKQLEKGNRQRAILTIQKSQLERKEIRKVKSKVNLNQRKEKIS